MTARIEVGRLSAVDLGKTVGIEGLRDSQLFAVYHYPNMSRVTLKFDGWGVTTHHLRSDMLVDITGKSRPKDAA